MRPVFRAHRRLIAVLFAGAVIAVPTACGAPAPSGPVTSAAAPQSADATSESSAAPTATPTSTPASTPTPLALSAITSTARVVSGDSIQVEGTIRADGAPLPGALLHVSATPLDGRPQTVQLTGTVPAGAQTAHVGIRVNIEDIAEHGLANITIYRASYTQGASTKNRVPNPELRTNTNFWGLHEDGIRVLRSDIGPGLMIRIRDTATQSTIINTGGFPVTPGATFRATMRLKVTQSTVGHAYFTVTWLSSVTEIRRERLDLVPAPTRLPDRSSTSAGTFKARFDDLWPGRYRVLVTYSGDGGHLPTQSAQVVLVQ